jgi:ankyrin repeat protein
MKTMFAILTLALIVGSSFGQSAELHKAAYSGDVSKVREILQKGVNPDDRDSFGGTALHAAMFHCVTTVDRVLTPETV